MALFHPDPNHILNRLYRRLHIRVSKDGTEYGFDDLDPLLWMEARHLLTEPSHGEALRLLDEFLSKRAEQQISDPVKRAILQRDSWAVFDWAAPSPDNEDHPAREEIDNRLGPILRRLALTKEELSALPDPYARAMQKNEFPAEYDPARPEQPFLPLDFLDPHGSWVCIGVPNEEIIAFIHEFYFSRSVFFIFMRLPGGRNPTLAYLKQISGMKTPLFISKKDGGSNFWIGTPPSRSSQRGRRLPSSEN